MHDHIHFFTMCGCFIAKLTFNVKNVFSVTIGDEIKMKLMS
jgi:hypothetical protein